MKLLILQSSPASRYFLALRTTYSRISISCLFRKIGTLHARGKGKVIPVLELSTTPWRRIGEWKYRSTHSLTLALEGGEGSASRPSRFIPRERPPGTHWVGDWVGPRAVLETVVKRKIPSPRRESNPRPPIVQPVAQRYTDWVDSI
jgi:hypothetical protein